MPTDNYGSQSDTITSAALAPYAVTPSDGNDLPLIPKGIWIGTGGDVVLRGINSASNVTFKAVPSGFIIPVLRLPSSFPHPMRGVHESPGPRRQARLNVKR